MDTTCQRCGATGENYSFENDDMKLCVCKTCLAEKRKFLQDDKLLNKQMLRANNIGFCKTCNEIKTVENFPKGSSTLHICKSCVNTNNKAKIACVECKKEISYGNMNKHMLTHKNNTVICECGKDVKKQGLKKHLKTSVHLKHCNVDTLVLELQV